MSKEVIAKSDPVGEKVGFYSMGEKANHQAFRTIPHLGALPIRVKEMEEIAVTVIRLEFKEVEDVGDKNLENLIVAYPGELECSGDPDCASRMGVAKSNFKGCVDTYSDYAAAMRAVCIMKSPNIPHDVMVSNIEADRPLNSAVGFTETGYVPSSRRFQTKLRGVHDLWIGTQGTIPNLLARRFRREFAEKHFHRGIAINRRRRAIMGIALARRRRG